MVKIQNSVNESEARKAVKGNNSAEALKMLKPDETDGAPILKRYMTNNATYEALGELLMENPNGLLVESDELVGLLKQLDANGQEVARSFYLTAADGDKPYGFDRIGRGRGRHIDALCLSIIGGIQPGVLANGKLTTPFKTRDIYQKGWAGLETPNKAQTAINLLVEYRHLKEEEKDTGGRPTTHYHWIKGVAS